MPGGSATGFQVVRVYDDKVGGFTMRKRFFLLKGIRIQGGFGNFEYKKVSLKDEGQTVKALEPVLLGPTGKPLPIPGWGRALPRWDKPNTVLTTDVINVRDRQRRYRFPSQSAYAVVGSGAAPLVYKLKPWKQIHRCSPAEAAVLQGFISPKLKLKAANVRDRNSLVGNGLAQSLWIMVGQLYCQHCRRVEWVANGR